MRIVVIQMLGLIVPTDQRSKETPMSTSATKIASAVLLIAGGLGLSGCATKSFVREQIAPVSQRVDSLETRLQTTDGTAKAALAEAQAATGQLQNSGQRIDQLTGRVDGVEQRLQAQEARPKRPRH
jgi:murein lipoprotein